VRVGAADGGQADLLEVVGTLHAGGRLADLLHGRQQQSDEDGDDGDHHQQLDEGERTPGAKDPDEWHGASCGEKTDDESGTLRIDN
jgi:hypothetical protein